MTHKNTVTVGIPAYNEERNISGMIKSVLNQRRNNFLLDKVVIISDGSNDRTEDKVRELQNNHSEIILIADGKRTGKAERLNQLYEMNKSDIFIQFDADIILSNSEVIENLVNSLISSGADVAGGNGRPVKGRKFIEIVSNAGDSLWYEIKKGFNGGDNIYNSQGCIYAFKKEFAQSLKYPAGTVSDHQYLYLEMKKNGKKFKFDESIIVYYRAPNNLRDFYEHKWRGINETEILKPYFGSLIDQSRHIPFIYKLKILGKSLLKKPVKTIIAIFSLMFVKLVVFFIRPRNDALHEKGLWKTLHSTKNMTSGKDSFAMLVKRVIIGRLYAIYNLLGSDRKIISVLCYHSISDEKYSHAINLEKFSEQMEKISHYAKFVSLDEIVGVLDGRKMTVPCVAVTFDDGYKDLTKVIPVLKKYNIPATVFVMSEPEKVDVGGIGNKINLLTLEEIKYLHSQGVAVGAHSATHADFRNLNEAKIKYEIVESKKILEDRLGFGVDYFAYPRGVYNEKIVEAVKRAGFKEAFTIEACGIKQGKNRWLIPRTTVTKGHKLSEIPAMFSPVSFFLRRISEPFKIWEKFLTYEK